MPFTAGEYLTSELTFKVGKLGLASAVPADMAVIVGMEGLSIAIDGKVVDWYAMDQGGFARAMMTGKKISISMSGKRSVGDPGQDYIAGLAFLNGRDCSTKFEINFPDGDKLTGNVVIDVKKFAGGDSTDPSGLDFEVIFDGKPTYTPAV